MKKYDRMTTGSKEWSWSLCLILSIVMGLTACQFRLQTPSPALSRIFASQITVQDLPQGWYRYGARMIDKPEAVGRAFGFGAGDSSRLGNISEDLYIYATLDAAKESYNQWVTNEIPPSATNAWITPQELIFTGRSDQMQVACLPNDVSSQGHYTCVAIGRYSDMIVILRGTAGSQQMTLPDFRRLLEAMDQRIVAAMSPTQ